MNPSFLFSYLVVAYLHLWLTFMENLPCHPLNTSHIVPWGEDADVGDGTIFRLLQAEAKHRWLILLKKRMSQTARRHTFCVKIPVFTLYLGISNCFSELFSFIYLFIFWGRKGSANEHRLKTQTVLHKMVAHHQQTNGRI